MNRRDSLKGIGALILVGVSSISLFEWIRFSNKIDFNNLVEKKALIAELAEIIIPRTSTPGAKDAQVENYIIGMLENCTANREQHAFLDGLNDLEKYALKHYYKGFIECSLDKKIKVLKHFEDKADYWLSVFNKLNNKFLGKPFFIQLKELTVQGYCNSEIGATKGLAYDYVPSTYQACIPLTEHQLSWATK